MALILLGILPYFTITFGPKIVKAFTVEFRDVSRDASLPWSKACEYADGSGEWFIMASQNDAKTMDLCCDAWKREFKNLKERIEELRRQITELKGKQMEEIVNKKDKKLAKLQYDLVRCQGGNVQ